jgi:hypothetical protein
VKYICLLCAILFACCVPVAAAVTYECTKVWGGYGSDDGEFLYPSGIAVDKITGDVYVADACKDYPSNLRIQKFDKDGVYKSEWGNEMGSIFDEFDDEFTNIVDIAAYHYHDDYYDGCDVHVADASNRIKSFFFDQNGVSFLFSWGEGKFATIGGIAVDDSENVYVADTYNNQIQKFAWDSTPLAVWGSSGTGNGQFNHPTDVAVDGDGNVIVADSGNGRIVKLDPNGNCLWQTNPVDVPFVSLWGIATDEGGNVFVTDEGANTVHMLDASTGKPLTHWGVTPSGENLFNSPEGIAVDSAGNVYVVERMNHRVQKWAPSQNVPPAITELVANPSSIIESETVTISGSFTDPDADEWTVTVDYGDDSENLPLVLNKEHLVLDEQQHGFSLSHTYMDNGTYTVTVTVDDSMAIATSTIPITVNNVAPTLTISGGELVDEGSTYTLNLKATDPGADTITSWAITWGDGSQVETVTGNPASVTHVYADGPATPTISATATDEDGTFSSNSREISVKNVAPTVTSIEVPLCPPMEPVRVGTAISASAMFSDPGTLDTHTVLWNWGDGTAPTAGTVSGDSVSGTHAYAIPGMYSPSVAVTDNDGGTGSRAVPDTAYIVIYDPDGGSSTGGGWFDSPAGAYKDQSSLTGKAHFSFASRYKTGETVPDSSVQFSLKQAKIDFKSTLVEWLVVAGSKATYTGVGTMNGVGGYGFLLSAIDDPSSADKIRMKIWDASGVIYDSQTGAADAADPSVEIGGGSIVIHP